MELVGHVPGHALDLQKVLHVISSPPARITPHGQCKFRKKGPTLISLRPNRATMHTPSLRPRLATHSDCGPRLPYVVDAQATTNFCYLCGHRPRCQTT